MPLFVLVQAIRGSISTRGKISPKVMAMMIRNAVAPFAAMVVGEAGGVLGMIDVEALSPSFLSQGLRDATTAVAQTAHVQ
jgi:hypothetical protein